MQRSDSEQNHKIVSRKMYVYKKKFLQLDTRRVDNEMRI